jgi:hypothetical protein
MAGNQSMTYKALSFRGRVLEAEPGNLFGDGGPALLFVAYLLVHSTNPN